MRSIKRTIVFSLMAIIFLVACSQNDDNRNDSANEEVSPANTEGATDSPAPENQTGSPLPVINRANYHTVEIKQMKFNPEKLIIKKGDTVVWVNNGITIHDVTEQPANVWSSKAMPVGTSWTMIAEKSAEYYCSMHVVMKGVLVVQD